MRVDRLTGEILPDLPHRPRRLRQLRRGCTCPDCEVQRPSLLRLALVTLAILFALGSLVPLYQLTNQPEPMAPATESIIAYACAYPTDGVLEAAAASGVVVDLQADCP